MSEAPVFTQLKARGFSCTTLSEDGHPTDGLICTQPGLNNSTDGISYPAPVGIIVSAETTHIDRLVVYFHGFQSPKLCGVASSPARLAENFKLYSQMKLSGIVNAAMVVPLSHGNDATFRDSMVGQFAAFMTWTKQALRTNDPDLYIAAHSGGGPTVGNVLAGEPALTRRVQGIVMLDATYGSSAGLLDPISNWRTIFGTNPRVKLEASVRPDHSTAARAGELQAGHPRNVSVQTWPERKDITTAEAVALHCAAPNKYFGSLLKRTLTPLR